MDFNVNLENTLLHWSCHYHTPLSEQLTQIIADYISPRMYYMFGLAGTGKSSFANFFQGLMENEPELPLLVPMEKNFGLDMIKSPRKKENFLHQ